MWYFNVLINCLFCFLLLFRIFQDFFFSHYTLFETQLQSLRVKIEKSFYLRQKFLDTAVAAVEAFREDVLRLCNTPRIIVSICYIFNIINPFWLKAFANFVVFGKTLITKKDGKVLTSNKIHVKAFIILCHYYKIKFIVFHTDFWNIRRKSFIKIVALDYKHKSLWRWRIIRSLPILLNENAECMNLLVWKSYI